jgi:hypothetical protein
MSSLWLDRKYIDLCSAGLRNFKWKSSILANCSCPFCGDSTKNKLKARFYFFEKENGFNGYCHNCGESMGFDNFLKKFNLLLHSEYVRERFFETASTEHIEQKIEKIKMDAIHFNDKRLTNIKKISQLKANHPAKIYVNERQIPEKFHYKLYYTPKFKSWINELLPGKFDAVYDEPRLVIPFFDKDKKMYAVQGRSFGNIEPKYYSIILNDNYPKIYGLDTIDYNRRYYILEGPIDSLFIPNSLGMAGSDFTFDLPNIYNNAVVIFDNQPRNSEIIRKMEACLNNGLQIVIWPDTLEHKDINDMIKSGMSSNDIMFIIKQNTFKDLAGILKLKKWNKVKGFKNESKRIN